MLSVLVGFVCQSRDNRTSYGTLRKFTEGLPFCFSHVVQFTQYATLSQKGNLLTFCTTISIRVNSTISFVYLSNLV